MASANELVISTDTPVQNILDHMIAVDSSDTEDKGFRHQRRLILKNGDTETTIWRLSTEMLKPVSFEFYQVSDEKTELIFAARYPYSLQKTRASQGRVLSSWPIVLQAGESVEIVAQFERPPGEELFPFKLRPEFNFDGERTALSYLHGWYLGAAFVFLIFFLSFSTLLSSAPARFYALYFFALSVLTFHSYGYTEQLFFGEVRWLYFPLFRLLQVGIMLSYLAFAVSFLRARENYPKLYRVTIGYIFLTAVLVCIETLTYREFFVLIVDVMALGFLGIGILTAYIAIRDRLNGAYFFAVGFLVLLVNGVVNYIASHRAYAVHNNQVDAVTLGLQLLDAFIFAAAIVSQTHGLRRDRDDALAEKLSATEEKLAVSEELRTAQQERDKAATLAERHRSRLASTSHDLRQPLTSLRLALREATKVEPALQEKMGAGLEYLNTVLDETLDETMPAESATENNFGEDDYDTGIEAVPLQLVFDNIERMFQTEAKDKSLELKFVKTDLVVQASTIVLIRIMSNLVANAIKFTHTGSVLVGARRRNDKISLQVWDTGVGIDEETITTIIAPYERGAANDESDGYGLGLSIVRELARDHKLILTIDSQPGQGSVFSVNGLIGSQ